MSSGSETQPAGSPPPSTPPLSAESERFTWETYRDFYPEPRWPREPTRKESRGIVLSLVVAGLLLLTVSGLYGWVGASGTVGNYEGKIHGIVVGSGQPLPDAGVVLTENGSPLRLVITNPAGYFTFTNVPEGMASLEIIDANYTVTSMSFLIAPFLEALEPNVTSLVVTLTLLQPGQSSEVRSMSFAPFPDIETYLTLVYSISLTEVIGGAVAIWGGLALRRARRPPRGVVGGSAAFLAPFFPLVLGGATLYAFFYPPSLVALAIASGLGLAAVVLILRTYRPLLLDDL